MFIFFGYGYSVLFLLPYVVRLHADEDDRTAISRPTEKWKWIWENQLRCSAGK